jgi:hypothetical protein
MKPWSIYTLSLLSVTILGLVLFLSVNKHYQSREIDQWKAQLQKSTDQPFSGSSQTHITRSARLSEVPTVVKQYLLNVLPESIPKYHHVEITQQGNLLMNPGLDGNKAEWKPFTASQTVRLDPPAFIWDARVRMMPLLTARVIDRYQQGQGMLQAHLWSAITVADAPQNEQLDKGELLRLLAESPWYPLLLHPALNLVQWKAHTSNSQQAWATLQDEHHEVRMLFTFGTDGLIEQVYADARFREVDGRYLATPWSGRFSAYQVQEGIMTPTEAEVAWIIDGQRVPYWQGEIQQLSFIR